MTQPMRIRALSRYAPEALRSELRRIAQDTGVREYELREAAPMRLVLEAVSPQVSRQVRTAARRAGCDVVHTPDGTPSGRIVLLGACHHLERTVDIVASQAAPAHQTVVEQLRTAVRRLTRPPAETVIGPLQCQWGQKTYVMGILNVTPDSFSGDGVFQKDEWIHEAIERARWMVTQGVDILDIGGESTRPGASPVDVEEELRRVLPVVEAVAGELDVALSIDTYKAEVARRAVEAGAHLINDVWGLRMDPDMGRVVAESGVPVVVMHNRSRPKDAVQEQRLGGRYVGVEYENLLADVVYELEASIARAMEAGVSQEKVIVDPGIGFGKTIEQNLTLLNRLDELRILGRPILLGTSRKSFIGYTLNVPVEERVAGTAATVTLGIERGADIVRVHDIPEMVHVARMTDAVLRRTT